MEPITDTDYRALAELRFEIRQFLAFSANAARSEGIEPKHHQLLLVIKGLAPEAPAVGTLAKRLLLQPHSAFGLVTRSAAVGLVATFRSEDDARVVRVRLLPRGEEVLERLSRTHRQELCTLAPRLVSTLRQVVGEEDP